MDSHDVSLIPNSISTAPNTSAIGSGGIFKDLEYKSGQGAAGVAGGEQWVLHRKVAMGVAIGSLHVCINHQQSEQRVLSAATDKTRAEAIAGDCRGLWWHLYVQLMRCTNGGQRYGSCERV